MGLQTLVTHYYTSSNIIYLLYLAIMQLYRHLISMVSILVELCIQFNNLSGTQ